MDSTINSVGIIIEPNIYIHIYKVKRSRDNANKDIDIPLLQHCGTECQHHTHETCDK